MNRRQFLKAAAGAAIAAALPSWARLQMEAQAIHGAALPSLSEQFTAEVGGVIIEGLKAGLDIKSPSAMFVQAGEQYADRAFSAPTADEHAQLAEFEQKFAAMLATGRITIRLGDTWHSLPVVP